MSLDCYDVNDVLDDDVYCAAKCFCDGLQGVEAYRILAAFYTADVVALIARHVGEVLLCHALCFAEVSNALTYPLSLFFFGHSSLVELSDNALALQFGVVDDV